MCVAIVALFCIFIPEEIVIAFPIVGALAVMGIVLGIVGRKKQ